MSVKVFSKKIDPCVIKLRGKALNVDITIQCAFSLDKIKAEEGGSPPALASSVLLEQACLLSLPLLVAIRLCYLGLSEQTHTSNLLGSF